MGAISRLDAVNHLLICAGEAIVSDLAQQSGTDIDLANYMIDQAARDVQLRGLVNNELVAKVYPDTNNQIVLRTDTLSCDLMSTHYTDDNRVIRGLMKGDPAVLWNITEDTDQWDQDTEYTLKYVLLLDWEDLDTSMQRYVLAMAARRYQITILGDAATDAYLAEQEYEAMVQAQRQDQWSRQATVFDTVIPSMQRVVCRNFMFDFNPRRY